MFSTGIYDHYQIYNKRIKKDYDILIYFPDPTDITDNHISRNRANQHMFKLQDDMVVKVEQDEKVWLEYFSTYNQIKRNYGFYVKKYSNTYKVYWTVKERWRYYKQSKFFEKVDDKTLIKELEEPKKIYSHFVKLFFDSFYKNEQKFIIVPTLKPNLFINSEYNNYRHEFLSKVWKNSFFYDPYLDAVEYMKKKDIYEYPFLSWECDSHYSHAGADFFSSYLLNKIDIEKIN